MTETRDTDLLLRAFVDELARCEIAGACTSPGSRSAPLVLALARDGRFPCWSLIDERAAGFFALGVAKATGRPVAIACTSGTAAAQYAPAVVEAHHARIPLLVLTADRPPELRGVGAGQAIDQLGLFGSAARWFFDVGTHDATAARLRWIRALACRAVAVADGAQPGPVHLNFALREPLVSDGQLGAEPGGGGRPDGRPWLVARRAPAAPATLPAAARPLLVAGRHERHDGLAPALAAAAERLGAPLLADPLSGARRGGAAIAHYDALLRDASFAAAQRPDLVIRVGDLPTSKPLRQWLAGLDAHHVAFDPEQAWQDPDAVLAEVLHADPLAWARDADGGGPGPWLAGWRAADAAAGDAIAATLGDELSEPAVARALAELASDAIVFTASSMPIRDVETFWPAGDARPRVLAHRGANGIDGTIAAALGVAAAGARVIVHLGDVALAHDIGALASMRRLGVEPTIVLVDNGGGAIFDFLPIATQLDVYEEHVATPPELDAAAAAALAGLPYVPVGDLASLRAALDRPGLVHVRSDRAANVALHRRVWAAVGAALAA